MEQKTKGDHTADTPSPLTGHIADLWKPNLKLSDFKLNATDKQSTQITQKLFDEYMLLKLACTEQGKTMVDIQSYLAC